jgi:tryptophan 2,3-dioxygenase
MATPTYWDYLRLDQLLSLQGGLEGDESQLMPDELHFIVVHQALELWFKLSLRALRLARDHLAEPRVAEETIPYVVHHLRRASAIIQLAVDHFRVMETLTPQDFLAFRDKLIPASGFQSFQMREIEIILGLADEDRIAYAGTDPLEHIRRLAEASPAGALAWSRIEGSRQELTLKSAINEWLYRTPVQGSGPDDPGDDETIDQFLADYLDRMREANRSKQERLMAALQGSAAAVRAQLDASEERARRFLQADDVPDDRRRRARRVRAGVLFIESYRELPLLAWPRLLIDTVVELEEQLVLFRGRHARMVERVIGRRVGTGGSAGVEYLDRTADYRIFTDLWEVRTILLPKSVRPELKRPEAYGFAR